MKPNRIVRQVYVDIVKEGNILKDLYNDLHKDAVDKDGGTYITEWGWKWYYWVDKYGNWKKE